jgi:DNA-binding NtrC family response regulator
MPDVDGLKVLAAAHDRQPSPQVIILTAFGTIESAVEALRSGAFTYLTKPVNLNELRLQVAKAMELQGLKRENIALRREIDRRYGFEDLLGETGEMKALMERLRAIADTRATVLIEGESGTGKELVARALHKNSSRSRKPFIPIHCAALSESLIESELFGHEKGAFTGAIGKKQGLFEIADGGTVLLDEVGEIPLTTQVKLLRVLETKEFLRVGGTESHQVDVRVIAATNRSLTEEVEESRFREDLFYRLNVVRVTIPPLRNRSADIPVLVESFLKEFVLEHRRQPVQLTKRALNRLMQFPWPGNVRQLRNVLESLVLFSRGSEIDVDDLPPEITNRQAEDMRIEVGVPLDQIERKVIERTLIAAGGNRTRTAEQLGISRRTLLRKIKELGLEG